MLLLSPPVRKGGHSMHRAVLLWAQPIHMLCLKSVSSLISEECPPPRQCGLALPGRSESTVCWFADGPLHRTTIKWLNHLMHENSVIFDGRFSAVFLPAPSIVCECCSFDNLMDYIWWTPCSSLTLVLIPDVTFYAYIFLLWSKCGTAPSDFTDHYEIPQWSPFTKGCGCVVLFPVGGSCR